MIKELKPNIFVVDIPVNAAKIKLSIVGKDNCLIHDESSQIKLPKGEYEIVGVYKIHEQDYIYSPENEYLDVPIITADELESNGLKLTSENKYIILKSK